MRTANLPKGVTESPLVITWGLISSAYCFVAFAVLFIVFPLRPGTAHSSRACLIVARKPTKRNGTPAAAHVLADFALCRAHRNSRSQLKQPQLPRVRHNRQLRHLQRSTLAAFFFHRFHAEHFSQRARR